MKSFNNLKLNWIGWTNYSSGYGVVNLEYAVILDKLTNGGVTVPWERREHMASGWWNQLTDDHKKVLSKPVEDNRVGVIKTTPNLFWRNINKVRIGYTMVENTKVASHWVKEINKMDAVFVPSNWLIAVFKDSGVKIPIYRVKQGINSNRFPYYDRPEKDIFTFAMLGYMDERKNWELVVRAFCSEFRPVEPVRLVIKNNGPRMGHWTPKGFSVYFNHRQYSFDELRKFYNNVDCFLAPSRCEGSGLTPREAMATGCPAIVTDWSGLTEISSPEISYPIKPVAIDQPDVRGKYDHPGMQARLNPQELMGIMRYVYEHRKEAKEKGKKASEFIHREYNWQTCGEHILDIIKEF